MTPRPIDALLPQVRQALAGSNITIISADPGAGKTTRIPPALLDQPWLRSRRIVILEPRRLAARRAAEFMSLERGEAVGQTVGYRIRGESRVSAGTRIEVVTEGILTRMLHADPAMRDVGCVIFDEFHERSIHADLGLALTLDTQEHLRPDLRIIIMSATLDGVRIADILPEARVLTGPGLAHPVSTVYLGSPERDGFEEGVCRAVLRALDECQGDVLVFLPGQREIRRVGVALDAHSLLRSVKVHPLFGEAGYRQQQIALAPAPAGVRKVILSTSIAETSLTIDGVRVVVDCGLSRTSRFDTRRGMSGLITTPVSRATADQRRGRAARQGPGTCYRLWSKELHETLAPFPHPEILNADLAPLALDLARWGDPDGSTLRFIDQPPTSHLRQAQALIRDLGGIDRDGHVTEHGREVASLPAHPRLAHMMLRAKSLDAGNAACTLAAILEERDLITPGDVRDILLQSRWEAFVSGAGGDHFTRQRIRLQARRYRDVLNAPMEDANDASLGLLLALAYPDRIAQWQEGNRFLLRTGTRAVIPANTRMEGCKYLAVADADGIGTEVRVFLASPLDAAEIEKVCGDDIEEVDELRWAPEREAVDAARVRRVGAIVLSRGSVRPDGPPARRILCEGIRLMGLDVLPWTREARGLQQRCEWLRSQRIEQLDWPDLSDPALLATLEGWLEPHLHNMWQRSHLQKLNMAAIISSLFPPSQVSALHRLAPSHLKLPSGSRIAVQYNADQHPVLAVRLQELFGQTDSPKVAGGRIAVVIHLLSPAGRPLAVTQDLRSFWLTTYPEIRKQLRARYPKHYWPEDPLSARPTNKTRRLGPTHAKE